MRDQNFMWDLYTLDWCLIYANFGLVLPPVWSSQEAKCKIIFWRAGIFRSWKAAWFGAERYPSSHWENRSGTTVSPQRCLHRPVEEQPQPQSVWIFMGVNIRKYDWGLKFVIVEPCTQHVKTKPQQHLALLSDVIFSFEPKELSATSSDQRWSEGLAPTHCQVLHPLHANCYIAQQLVDFAW